MDTVTLTVPSHPKYLSLIRGLIYPLALNDGFSKKEARRIVLAIDEACANIIKYAYEGDVANTILVAVVSEAAFFRVTLTDYGKQVDAASIVPRALEDIRPGGLGTHFIRTVFDSVLYDTNQPKGTVLTLEKKKSETISSLQPRET